MGTLHKVEFTKQMKVRKVKELMARELGYDDPSNIVVFLNGEEVVDDKESMKDTPLFNQEGQFKGPDAVHITCHIFLSITVEVLGKGKDYSSYVNVRP